MTRFRMESNLRDNQIQRQMHMTSLVATINTVNHGVGDILFRIASGYTDSLNSGAASPLLISNNDLVVLKEHGTRISGKEVSTKFFDLRVSIVRRGSTLILLIRAPIEPEAHRFQVYRFTPIPIFKANMTLEAQSRATFIAVNVERQAFLYYHDLPQCVVRQSPVLCEDNSQPIRKTFRGECPATLFSQYEAECPLVQSNFQSDLFLHRVRNKVVYSSRFDLTFQKTCHGIKSQPIKRNGMGIIEITNCSLVVASRTETFLFPEVETFVISADSSTPQMIFLVESIQNTPERSFRTEVERHLQLETIPTLKKILPRAQAVHYMTYGSVAAIAVVIIILFSLCVIGWRHRSRVLRYNSRVNDFLEKELQPLGRSLDVESGPCTTGQPARTLVTINDPKRSNFI